PDAPGALFSRFGRDLPAAWEEHLSYNVSALADDDALIALGVYAPGQLGRLRGILRSLRDVPFSFGLCHGDLAPRNLIEREGGEVLIDWGAA
ncbi:phosphotransferase, partial [Brevibacillus sp. SIMBA_076]